jgi:division protein CdvB (Snf7/Vps24/ESCRT-III family)
MVADPKPTKLATALKFGLAIGAIAVLEPVIVLAAQGVVALGVAIVGGLAIVNFAPWVEMKFKNLGLKAVKHEAAKNPIETLQNQWIAQKKALEERAIAVKAFNTETQNYADKVEEFSTKYPAKAPQYQKQLAKMRYVLQKQLSGLQKGKKKLDEFSDKIEETEAEWNMALAAAAANSAMQKFEQPDPIEFIKQQTALNAVRSAMNDVISDLDNAIALDYSTVGDDVIDVEMKQVQPQAAIENNTGDVLEGLLNVTDPVAVKR